MIESLKIANLEIPLRQVHTLVLGSGAAGLNAAIQLNQQGITDLLIITEGLELGTSINTGSDKQTYYKLGMYGAEPDSQAAMAKSLFDGGSMHGDLAMTEAAVSARAFLHLVDLGVKFPQDSFGQFVGYKTDHDPRQRATSSGPYTSRDMCRALIAEVKRRNIPILEHRVSVSLLTQDKNGDYRVFGLIALNTKAAATSPLEAYIAENVIFAVGGPGGLYQTSVYPQVHTGAIGLALQEGAIAQNLPESQYGMASVKFRWNVSGTYMQVIPRFISTAADGHSDEQEFLRPYFADAGRMNSAVFLKGYQWPFDPRKVSGGSSLIDILVYIETAVKGRRVFLDYRRNATGFDLTHLSPEAYEYLKRSQALSATPIERLRLMNPDAIRLYEEHNIHLVAEPLEIAVCAQHNNGGLAANLWWESVNIKHLFPIGEVNGSHGVYRPGGAALNSGQVGGFRAAAFIAAKYAANTLDREKSIVIITQRVLELQNQIDSAPNSDWRQERKQFQARMTHIGSHIRSQQELDSAIPEAWEQYHRLSSSGCNGKDSADTAEYLRNIQLCLTHVIYLEAISAALHKGVGSRGSALVLNPNGIMIHEQLGNNWSFVPENTTFRDKVQETVFICPGSADNSWRKRRPLPDSEAWFETAWADYREGIIYNH